MTKHKDKNGKQWTVEHKARAESDIFKECSTAAYVAGKQRLGKITQFCEPRGDGYRWEDHGGVESECYSTEKECLLGFIAEMERRREENRARQMKEDTR